MPQIKWLSSKDAQKTSKIIGYDLMHFRLQGKLEFEKRSNAYFYSKRKREKNKTQFLIEMGFNIIKDTSI
jgi:hypothetical protein